MTYLQTMEILLQQNNIISENTIELTFEKPIDFFFIAGQYVFLKVTSLEGEEYMRSMSICSHPNENVLRFTMRDGISEFKNRCREMVAGDSAEIVGPKGSFVLHEDNNPIVFFAGGIGVTPVIAMLRELELQKFKKQVFLFYSNATEEDATYLKELEEIELEKYTPVTVFTKYDDRINVELLSKHVEKLDAFSYYIVGTNNFVTEIKHMLRESGVSVRQIYTDNFGI